VRPVTTTTLQVEQLDKVAVVRLNHGKASALDTELCRDLVSCLAGLTSSRAVVLTGTGGIFSAGVDLHRILAGGAAYIDEFLTALSDAFIALFTFPGPVVAALNGHAIAGGAVLAAASDHRVMNDAHGRIGVTELVVGVPFPISALEVLRCAYGRNLRTLVYFGQTYPAAEALSLGLVDETVPEPDVLTRALEVAHQLAAIPPESFRRAKELIRRPYLDRVTAGRAADAEHVRAGWSSPEVLTAIDAYVSQVLRR
jgi:enoyl-CoA hydratase